MRNQFESSNKDKLLSKEGRQGVAHMHDPSTFITFQILSFKFEILSFKFQILSFKFQISDFLLSKSKIHLLSPTLKENSPLTWKQKG